MATLSVWRFPTPQGAEQAEQAVLGLRDEHLVVVQDAATVSWPPGHRRPRTRQSHHPALVGALGGTFWGLLLGLLFVVPLAGAAVGALAGVLGGALSDVGIDDDFIRDVRARVTPGTSALFLLTSHEVPDRLVEELRARGLHAELVRTNLSDAQDARLRAAFEEGV